MRTLFLLALLSIITGCVSGTDQASLGEPEVMQVENKGDGIAGAVVELDIGRADVFSIGCTDPECVYDFSPEGDLYGGDPTSTVNLFLGTLDEVLAARELLVWEEPESRSKFDRDFVEDAATTAQIRLDRGTHYGFLFASDVAEDEPTEGIVILTIQRDVSAFRGQPIPQSEPGSYRVWRQNNTDSSRTERWFVPLSDVFNLRQTPYAHISTLSHSGIVSISTFYQCDVDGSVVEVGTSEVFQASCPGWDDGGHLFFEVTAEPGAAYDILVSLGEDS